MYSVLYVDAYSHMICVVYYITRAAETCNLQQDFEDNVLLLYSLHFLYFIIICPIAIA